MTRPRGRPPKGDGVELETLLATALALLEDAGGRGLTMRALAAELGVTPMSLYHHVADRKSLLSLLCDRVYAQVLKGIGHRGDARTTIRLLMKRYHRAVSHHPQLTLAIFATPDAFPEVAQRITDRLTTLLEPLTSETLLWRDILVDHAHGSALAQVSSVRKRSPRGARQPRYEQALVQLLAQIS